MTRISKKQTLPFLYTSHVLTKHPFLFFWNQKIQKNKPNFNSLPNSKKFRLVQTEGTSRGQHKHDSKIEIV